MVAAGTLPRALMLLFGGVVADRFDTRRVMVLANTMRIVVLVAVVVRVALAAWGLGGSATLDALTFAGVAAVLVLWLRPRYPLPRAGPEHPLRGIARGFAHLRDEPATRSLVVAVAGLNLFIVPAESLGIALRAREQGWGAGAVGVLLALMGVGAALGSAATLRWRPRFEARAGFVALVVQGVGIAWMGVGPQAVIAGAGFVVGGTAGVASVLLGAVFQARVDGAYLGRMASVQQLGDGLLMPVSMAGFGALAGLAGTTPAFAAYGVAMMLLVTVPLVNPALRAISLRSG